MPRLQVGTKNSKRLNDIFNGEQCSNERYKNEEIKAVLKNTTNTV